MQFKASKIISKINEISENTDDGWKYFQFFRSQPKECFALIYPDSESVFESWDSLFHDLRILWQLELYPVVVLNSSLPGYVKRFLKAGFTNKLINYFPISLIHKPISIKERVLTIVNKKNKIPIILTQNQNNLELKLFLLNLLEVLNSNKLIILNSRLGIRTKDDQRISVLNLPQDYETILSASNLIREDISLINDINFLLNQNSNRRLTISITSASLLLKELFTIKGSGTLIKRGSSILYSSILSSIPIQQIIQLVESSFQKKCNSRFINSLSSSDWEIIYESNYKGCALLKKTNLGVLLSKFAVDEIARGEGVGREIWEKMKKIYPFIFWRGRRENPISTWYMNESDGMYKQSKWIYFWMGKFIDYSTIIEVIQFLDKLPEDWELNSP